jgi:hypothetical protein
VGTSDRRAEPVCAATDEELGLPSTVRPPFDPEQFARESETKVSVDATPRSDRPTAPPPPGIPQYAPGEASGTLEIGASLDPSGIPELAIARDDLPWFELAPLARQVLAHVDGQTSIEGICTHASLDIVEGMCLFCDLMREGIVTFRG